MPLRLGLVGLKGHHNVVIDGAKQLGDVELVAVADDDAAELKTFMQQEPLAAKAQSYAAWSMLFEHSMLDVCCLSDANDLHAPQLLTALARNIDIVTEKPLALSLADLDRVRAALTKSTSRLTTLLTMRHEAKYPTVRKLIQDGAVGEICQITAQKSYQLHTRPAWFKTKSRCGGIIPYIGIHPVDLIRWTTGLEFETVAAVQSGLPKHPELGETEAQASILARLSNGAGATIRLDYLRAQTYSTHGDDRLRIIGSKGMIETRGDEEKIWLSTQTQPLKQIEPGPATNLFAEYRGAIAEGKPWPISAADSLRATKIVLLARTAAEEGRVVEVKAEG